MSRKEKLIKKIKSNPKDFTYQEVKTLLGLLEFHEFNRGKTSGSRVSFIHNDTKLEIKLHKPHPSNTLKPYQIELIIAVIKRLEEMK